MPAPFSRTTAGRALFPQLVLLVAAALSILVPLPPHAAASATPKSVFKPDYVRFIERRAIVSPWSSSSSHSSSSVARANKNGKVRSDLPRNMTLLNNLNPWRARPEQAGPDAAAADAPTREAPSGGKKGGGPGATPRGEVELGFRALNAYESAVATYGNAFDDASDPPDQSLAVGLGYVVASVNAAVRVYDRKDGKALRPAVSLRELYGLGSSEDCAFLSDPTTLWDPELHRFFQITFRLETSDDCEEFTGRSYLEIAVSKTPSPLKSWYVYTIDASLDGGGGSPVVPGCEEGCLSDFPRAQLDPSVLVITVNIFNEVVGRFVGAGVLVLDKFALAKGARKAALAEFYPPSAGDFDDNTPLYSISPSYVPPGHRKGPPGSYDEPFLLMATSAKYVRGLLRFALTGTRAVKRAVDRESLDDLIRALRLSVSPATMPGPLKDVPSSASVQPRAGNFPLGESEGATEPGLLGAPDFRMYSSAVAAGRHYGAFNTYVTKEVDGEEVKSIAVGLVQLDAETGKFLRLDLLGEPGENVMFPGVAVGRKGEGGVVAIAASRDLFPSVAFFAIKGGDAGRRQFGLKGRGLQDTHTQYPPSYRPRSGDYSGAVIDDHGLFWGGAEYVSKMSCSLDQWIDDETCSKTRAADANWDTGIIAVKV